MASSEPVPAPQAVSAERVRVRPSYLTGLLVALVAGAAGLLGAWVGVRLAESDRAPARIASTLGLVTVEPRSEPLPTMDVLSAAEAIAPSVVSVSSLTESGAEVGRASGSGLVLTADGEILTNAHVIEGAVAVSVRVPGETEPRRAVIVASDVARDLALLRIEADGLTPAQFAAPGDVRVGDSVVAVGYALDLDGDPSVTVGIVSALDRTSADDVRALKGLIQTDAPISSGNSGGPLVNSLGQVVGITTFVAGAELGSTANNIGFAISTAELLPTVGRLRASVTGATRAEGYLGVVLADRFDGGSGALVTEVQPDSPAQAAGIRVGDAVVAIGDTTVSGRAGFIAEIRGRTPGDEVKVEVRRDGQLLTLTATLAERPAD